jgi:hypothetical protein
MTTNVPQDVIAWKNLRMDLAQTMREAATLDDAFRALNQFIENRDQRQQGAEPVAFEQVEDCFGEDWTTEPDGRILLTAQQLHDFAQRVNSAATPPQAEATRKLEEAGKDAERYRFMRDLHCNQFSVSYNDGPASNYMTAKEWIEEAMPEWFEDDPVEEVEKMKSTNSIWTLQVYPNTPVRFNAWNASTLDAVIDQAIEQGKGGDDAK